jgi:hypothetical protein
MLSKAKKKGNDKRVNTLEGRIKEFKSQLQQGIIQGQDSSTTKRQREGIIESETVAQTFTARKRAKDAVHEITRTITEDKDGKKETHEEERIRACTLEEELEAKHSVTRFVERFKETEAQESIKSATTPPMGLGVEKFIQMLHTRVTGQLSLRTDKPLSEVLDAARESWWYQVYNKMIKNFPSVELKSNPKENVAVLYAAYEERYAKHRTSFDQHDDWGRDDYGHFDAAHNTVHFLERLILLGHMPPEMSNMTILRVLERKEGSYVGTFIPASLAYVYGQPKRGIWVRIDELRRAVSPLTNRWWTTWLRLQVKLENGMQTQLWMPAYFALSNFKDEIDSAIIRNAISEECYKRDAGQVLRVNDPYTPYREVNGVKIPYWQAHANTTLRPALAVHRLHQQQEEHAYITKREVIQESEALKEARRTCLAGGTRQAARFTAMRNKQFEDFKEVIMSRNATKPPPQKHPGAVMMLRRKY